MPHLLTFCEIEFHRIEGRSWSQACFGPQDGYVRWSPGLHGVDYDIEQEATQIHAQLLNAITEMGAFLERHREELDRRETIHTLVSSVSTARINDNWEDEDENTDDAALEEPTSRGLLLMRFARRPAFLEMKEALSAWKWDKLPPRRGASKGPDRSELAALARDRGASDRLTAIVSILLGNLPDMLFASGVTISEVVEAEIGAIRVARRRLEKSAKKSRSKPTKP